MDEPEITYEYIAQEMKLIKEEAQASYTATPRENATKIGANQTNYYDFANANITTVATLTQQLISKDLILLLSNYLQDKTPQIIPNADVILNYNQGFEARVIPDLIILCDQNKIKNGRIFGTPELVIEIVTTLTNIDEKVKKRYKYELAGVQEYWIIDSQLKKIEVLLLNSNGIFTCKNYKIGEVIKVSLFKDLMIKVADVFANPWLRLAMP